VVADICKAEKVGLDKFFKANPGPGRDDILATLKRALDELPEEVTNKCPPDAEFEPEFVKGEGGDVAALSSVLAKLREQSAALTRYEENIAELGTEYGIWLTADQIPKSAAGGGKRGNAETVRLD